jgi:hypothetical protein
MRNFATKNFVFEFVTVVPRFTINAVLVSKASMRLDNTFVWHAREPLKCVDVLCKTHLHEFAIVQHFDKGMRGGGPIFPWEELLSKSIDLIFVRYRTEDMGLMNKHGAGFSRKKPISNTASGYGRLRR